MKKITILGCGWLGLPLGQFLSKSYEVHGTTTQVEKFKQLEQHNIIPHHLDINGTNVVIDQSIFETDCIISLLPPRRSKTSDNYYLNIFEKISPFIKNIPMVFVSSTSVYSEASGSITELTQTKPNASGQVLLDVEKHLEAHVETLTVLRFSGLIGNKRNPARFLAGKKSVANYDLSVNLIHQDDCIQIIEHIIRKNIWNEIFNAACDYHETREGFYTKMCKLFELELPEFDMISSKLNRIISNDKIKKSLNYTFIHNDLVNKDIY